MEGFEKRFLGSAAWRIVTQRAVLPWILHGFDLPAGARVLEVGSGGGFNAEGLLVRFPAWTLVATDYDPEMVAIARRRLEQFGERVRVEEADATSLPYADGSFDLVISIGVWHHVGAWEKALAECARVLPPAGRLLLVDLLPGFFVGPLRRLFPPIRTYRADELRRTLPNAGFARWRMTRAGPFFYKLMAETESG